MSPWPLAAALSLAALLPAPPLLAFCGFYVAKADAKLFNRASQVALVRDGDRTVVTMSADFKGEPREFAMVVPVPTFITREQINVADKALLDHLDAFSAPRLVEYHDPDPCLRELAMRRATPQAAGLAAADAAKSQERARSLGVTIEAQYTVGEYDILILSARESDGLVTWLRESGYRLPAGAGPVVGSYLAQKMRFFVARVNLEEKARLGFSYLRPLQIAYESPKFMLPIRLGTVNANGPQELFVFALTRRGRVETTNYRTVRLPTGQDVPLYVREEFGRFYKALFSEQVRREDKRAVFLEYAWDMSWCDPCAADPLSPDELRRLGIFWLDESGPGTTKQSWPRPGGPVAVFLTRLHVRYDGAHFPEDLVFQETADRENFQGRYVLRHPWTGGGSCAAMADYRRQVALRQEKEAQNLSWLTGWKVADIRRRMGLGDPSAAQVSGTDPWWKRLWSRRP